MIYIKENGVTLEDSGPEIGNGPEDPRKYLTVTVDLSKDEIHVTSDEAETILRGLLRWKLENEGWTSVCVFVQSVENKRLRGEGR